MRSQTCRGHDRTAPTRCQATLRAWSRASMSVNRGAHAQRCAPAVIAAHRTAPVRTARHGSTLVAGRAGRSPARGVATAAAQGRRLPGLNRLTSKAGAGRRGGQATNARLSAPIDGKVRRVTPHSDIDCFSLMVRSAGNARASRTTARGGVTLTSRSCRRSSAGAGRALSPHASSGDLGPSPDSNVAVNGSDGQQRAAGPLRLSLRAMA
jgi:hypothetical protein